MSCYLTDINLIYPEGLVLLSGNPISPKPRVSMYFVFSRNSYIMPFSAPLGVLGLGFKVQGLGLKVWVQGLGFAESEEGCREILDAVLSLDLFRF